MCSSPQCICPKPSWAWSPPANCLFQWEADPRESAGSNWYSRGLPSLHAYQRTLQQKHILCYVLDLSFHKLTEFIYKCKKKEQGTIFWGFDCEKCIQKSICSPIKSCFVKTIQILHGSSIGCLPGKLIMQKFTCFGCRLELPRLILPARLVAEKSNHLMCRFTWGSSP